MAQWLLFSLLALVLWGIWAFFPKLATAYIDQKSTLVYGALGSLLVGIVVFFMQGFKLEAHPKGVLFATLSGVAGAVGALFFIYALSRGNTSVVVVITALYPLITILLAYVILHESLSAYQMIGIALAFIAVAFIAKG